MVLNEEQWIKELREKRIAYGISQGRLAVASGITREYLNKIESGKMKPSKELLETLHKELARFNPEAPLTMLFDYVKIRFPTLDIQHIIKDILKLNINYMLHEDYGHYSYTEHYSLGDIFIYTSADEEKGVLLELKGRGCRQFESYLLAQQRSWYIINMSFAITTAPGNELSDLCLELSKNKIVVAAAANNYDGRSFPACYESVCGVRGGKIKNNKVYEIDTSKEIQCLFDNNPLMSMTLNNEYQMLPTNNSLITAKFTGMICQCISKYDIQKEKYTDILQIMQKENREQKSKIYTSSQEWYMDNNDELLQAIYELLKSVLQLHKPTNNICDIELLTSRGSLRFEYVYDILSYLESRLNIKINYMTVSRYDMLTVGTLTKFFKESGREYFEKV